MLKKNKILVVFLLLFNVLNAETLNNEMDSIEQMLIRGDFEQSEKRLNIVEQLALDSNNLKLYKRVLSFQLHCYESLFKKNEFLITTDKIYELGACRTYNF